MPDKNSTKKESSILRLGKSFLQDQHAVSPVVGVALLVAVAVIIATSLAVFVFAVGDGVGNPAPSGQVEFVDSDALSTVNVTYSGGETLDSENTETLAVKGGSNVAVIAWVGDASETDRKYTVDDSITSGDEIVALDISGAAGETVELVWESDSGSSSVIGEYDVPADTSSPSVGVDSTDDGDNTIDVTVN